MPVMRSLWPGIDGKTTGSSMVVSNMRKRAVQASRFMLQMMQAPLLIKETTKLDDNENQNLEADPSLDFESGEEGLAVRIAVEVRALIFAVEVQFLHSEILNNIYCSSK